MARIGIEDRGLVKRQEAEPPNLDTILQQMEAALESGDIRTLANLNETAMALLASLRQDLTSDDRYLRTMMNQRGASPEDIAYADALTRQLGQARRIINMTESAARQEREGGTTAAKFGVPLLGDIAAQGLAEPGIAASKEATEQASRSIRGTAGSQARAATKAGGIARSATGRAGAAGAAASRASQAVTGALEAVPAYTGKPAIGTLEKTAAKAGRLAAGEKGVAGAARLAARQAAAQAAASKIAAKGWGNLVSKAAPRIFGGVGLAAAELALTPLLEFYKSDRKLASTMGQLEAMTETAGGPLTMQHVSDTDMERVLENSGEDLLTILRDKGIIDTDLMNWAGIAEPTYDPDIEADVQAQSQRRLAQGGRRATSPAWQQTAGEMEKIGGSVPRLGAEEAGMAEVPTPQRRRMAAENAVAKSRFSPEALANIQDIGEREAEVQPPGHAAAYRKAADEAELRGLGTGTTDVAVSTEDGDVATISVANARSEQSKKLFRNLLNAFTGGEETKEGRVAEQQAGKVLTE
jgi:hypothetical protein